MCVSISVGVFLNIAPNIANALKNGKNVEVAQRSPIESEVYALKMIHLLLPYQQHRIAALRTFTQEYNKNFPLSNTVSAIGAIGTLGFLSMMFAFFRATAGEANDRRTSILMLLTFMLLFTATVGGLNVLFATLISPMIRGWDRISIFIGFFSVAAFFIAFDRFLKTRAINPYIAGLSLVVLTTIGILDQTAKPSYNAALTSKAVFFQDRKFIGAIENLLPTGAAVYQMPYVPFPEAGNVSTLGGYDLLVGFLNSRHLRWNSGGMQGRKADLFYRELSKKPLSEQLASARSMDFAGIYVDKRGYPDSGRAVIDEISKLIGQSPALTRDDGQVVFFVLKK
jgi:phosphoglycerol transferase